jgi:hypothetical protein
MTMTNEPNNIIIRYNIHQIILSSTRCHAHRGFLPYVGKVSMRKPGLATVKIFPRPAGSDGAWDADAHDDISHAR